MSPNEHITFFRIIVPKAKVQDFLNYVDYHGDKKAPFEFEVYYSSIYKEQWRINSANDNEYPELL